MVKFIIIGMDTLGSPSVVTGSGQCRSALNSDFLFHANPYWKVFIWAGGVQVGNWNKKLFRDRNLVMKYCKLTLLYVPCCFIFVLLIQAWVPAATQAQEPDWYPYVLARGNDRSVIKNTHINDRPYRPLHFYGNAVRRNYYRGNPAPMPKDLIRASTVRLRRR